MLVMFQYLTVNSREFLTSKSPIILLFPGLLVLSRGRALRVSAGGNAWSGGALVWLDGGGSPARCTLWSSIKNGGLHGTILMAGWWFETCLIFPYIGNNHMFQRGRSTTNQESVDWMYYIDLNGNIHPWIVGCFCEQDLHLVPGVSSHIWWAEACVKPLVQTEWGDSHLAISAVLKTSMGRLRRNCWTLDHFGWLYDCCSPLEDPKWLHRSLPQCTRDIYSFNQLHHLALSEI